MNEEQIKEAIADKIEDAIWDNIDEGTFSYGSNTGAIVSDMAKASAAAVMALVEALEIIAGEDCERSSWYQSKARAALAQLKEPT